jgi:purine-binding chemotaxis protein CheW
MESLYLIARIAGQRVALAASAVQSVVEIEALTPVPVAPRHIAGLAALRSRVLTVIDSYAALGLDSSAPVGLAQAVVVVIDGHLYGLLVDEVEDVVDILGEPQPVRNALHSGWADVACGIVDYEDAAVLVVDAAALVAGRASLAA